MRKAIYVLALLLLLTSPVLAKDYLLGNKVTVTLKFTEETGLESYQMTFGEITGPIDWTAIPELPYTNKIQADVSQSPDGLICFYVRAKNKLGNWSDPVSACAYKSSSAPSGEIILSPVLKITIELKGDSQ